MPNYNLSTFNNNYQQISICDIPNKQQQNLKNIKTIHTETQLQKKRAVPTIKKISPKKYYKIWPHQNTKKRWINNHHNHQRRVYR